MKTLAFMGGMLFLAVGVVMMWQKMYPTYTYRYRLTVEIDTPEGVKSGSSVVEVKTIQYPRWMTLGTNSESTSIRGEATVIDLEERGLLFALLDTHSDVLVPRTLLGIDLHSRPLAKHAYQLSQMVGQKAEVREGYLPRMVWFRDMNNPTSVELVLHAKMCTRLGRYNTMEDYDCVVSDNFLDVFGKGVRLKKVTIEITDDEIAKDIHKYMPSYSNQDYMNWFKKLPYGDPKKIGPYNFAL